MKKIEVLKSVVILYIGKYFRIIKLTVLLLFIQLALGSYSKSVADGQKNITGANSNYSYGNISPDRSLALLPAEVNDPKRPDTRGLVLFTDWYSVWPGYLGFDQGVAFSSDVPWGVHLAVQEAETSRPVFQADRPWEYGLLRSASVLHTESGFKMWYYTFSEVVRDKKTGQTKKLSLLCYAESDDGFTWRKPELGLYEFAGSTANNILMEGESFDNVFRDRDGSYRLLISDGPPIPGGKVANAMYSYTSPDGIHWTLDGPVMDMMCDTQNNGFYDEQLGKYVLFVRYARGNRRAIAMTEGSKFGINDLSHPRIVLEPDPQDPPSLDFYTIAYSRHPEYRKVDYQSIFPDIVDSRGRLAMVTHHDARDMHFMFPSMFHRDRGPIDIQLAVSRDGKQWFRPERKAIIPLGLQSSGTSGALYAFPGIHVLRPGLWGVMYMAYDGLHNMDYVPNGYKFLRQKGGFTYHWATWKENRLVALQADTEGMCTVNLIGRADKLKHAVREIRLNYSTEMGGWIRVELISKNGLLPPTGATPIEGYTFADCDPLIGDSLSQSVTWKGSTTMPSNFGWNNNLLLRVHMMRAKLFSIEWE